MSMGIEEEDDSGYIYPTWVEERRMLFAACKEYRKTIDRLELELAKALKAIKDRGNRK